jgi:hypothetical protein
MLLEIGGCVAPSGGKSDVWTLAKFFGFVGDAGFVVGRW